MVLLVILIQLVFAIGSVTALMLPYSLTFIVVWTLYLLAYWGLGLPLGLQASYGY